MPLRLATIAIVLFWLGSVAWLCAVIWAPPSSRMAQIDPREVYRVFFDWNESTTMALLENGTRRGEIKISGGSGTDGESGIFERVLSLSGTTDRHDERSGVPTTHLSWRGNLAFTEAMELRDGELSLRIPDRELNAHLAFDGTGGGTPRTKARVEIAGNALISFDSDDAPDSAASSPPLPALGSLGNLVGIGPLDPSALNVTTEARMGTFNLAGREIRAFLLVLRGEEPGQELRAYLSEAGEPLRLETDFGFEAVSEILVPLDAYKRPSAKNHP